jgi:hypothetical protein
MIKNIKNNKNKNKKNNINNSKVKELIIINKEWNI